MYYFFQSPIPVNPKDKQLKFLGVRRKHLLLQILVRPRRPDWFLNAERQLTLYFRKKEGKGGIYLRAFTVEKQGEKHHVTQIEKR